MIASIPGRTEGVYPSYSPRKSSEKTVTDRASHIAKSTALWKAENNTPYPLAGRVSEQPSQDIPHQQWFFFSDFTTAYDPSWYLTASEHELLACTLSRLTTSLPHKKELFARILAMKKSPRRPLEPFICAPLQNFPEDLSTLPLGAILTATGNSLNFLAKKLPAFLFAFFSCDQIKTVDFSPLSGEQLDAMVEGCSDEDGIKERLAVFDEVQVFHFLNKTSGRFSHFFSERFYQTLPFSRLNTRQVATLFPLASGETMWRKKFQLQLVPVHEIRGGLRLLPDHLFEHLSASQMTGVDFFSLSKELIYQLFLDCRFSREKKMSRACLIPLSAVNRIVELENKVIHYLTDQQIQHIDPELLNQETLHDLFPPFTWEAVFPGCQHATRMNQGVACHFFEQKGDGFSKLYKVKEKDLEDLLNAKKSCCLQWAKRFTASQLEKLLPCLLPSVQQLIHREV